MPILKKKLGFFDEILDEEALRAIRDQCTEGEYPEEASLLSYLASGHGLLAVPGIVSDILSEKKEIIGSPDVLTDGEWAWTADVAYYVKRYHYRPSEDFMSHARRNLWTVPFLDDLSDFTLEGWDDGGNFA